jgi:hypothetical protein
MRAADWVRCWSRQHDGSRNPMDFLGCTLARGSIRVHATPATAEHLDTGPSVIDVRGGECLGNDAPFRSAANAS